MTTMIVMKGLLLHMVMSMMMTGLVFVMIARMIPRSIPLWVAGAMYGAIIWGIDQLGVLQALNPTMAEHMNPMVFLIAHLAFGMVLGLYLTWRMRKQQIA